MLNRILLFFTLWLPASVFAYPLLEAEQLQQMLTDNSQALTLIDIRPPADYQQAHLQGAITAPYGVWRGPEHNPGQLLGESELQALANRLGLIDQPIVVYSSGVDQTDFGAAARVYWTLKYMGFTQLSVLNGGLAYWQQLELPVTAEVTQPVANNRPITLQPELVILQPELEQKVRSQDALTQILDARPQLFYQGGVKAPTASTPGTIAGATNIEFQQWFAADNRLKEPAVIKQLVQQQGLDKAPETVSFCNTGHWAATNWFVLSEVAGLSKVRLYPASLAEWTQAERALPMDNTPTRLQQIKNKFQQLVN